jgi:hypothetical protein
MDLGKRGAHRVSSTRPEWRQCVDAYWKNKYSFERKSEEAGKSGQIERALFVEPDVSDEENAEKNKHGEERKRGEVGR